MTQIVIELSKSTNAKRFADSNLIHSDEFKKAKDWIDERIEKIKKKEIEERERLHDTITILGSRGSGKTSFLLSLLDSYINEEDAKVIDVIDPTLIEEKGHIFLTIISQIADVVKKKLAKSDCNPTSHSYLKKNEWDEKLKSLAAGIPSIDGIGGNYDSWQDPEFIMHKGLRSVHAAKKLESDFHELLKLGLEILGKKVFIIALDDIDIDFRKGWPVLETIRKYLTSPYLITLLSGDLKLFSKAIRKQQWKNFGKALLKNEGEQLQKMNDYEDLVTEMEGQYLQKVMQPQRRIRLTTIQEKIEIKGKDNIDIYINDENKPENRIDKFYNSRLQKLGINSSYQAEAFRTFLLSLPIRTQIQYLSGFKNSEPINNINIIDAFLSDLYEKRVNIDIAKSTVKFLNTTALDLLIREKVLDEAYQIQPTTTDISLNASLLSLSLLFSQHVRNNPFLIFDYFIRIGYTRNLLSILPYQDNDKNSSLNPSIEGLCKHSALYQDRVFKDISCYMTAYIRAFLNTIEEERDSKLKTNIRNWGGIITLPGFAFIAKKGKDASRERIDKVFEDSTLFEQYIAYIPLSVSQPNSKQQTLPTYSIYTLLATIGELIRQNKEMVGDLDKGVSQLAQVRSYPMPNFANYSTNSDTSEDVFEPNEENTTGENLSAFINNWISLYSRNSISPYLLGKISTRFFYALRVLEQKEEFSNLGDAMHSRIIILLNSILLEDVRENILGATLSNNNPIDKNKIFIENLKKVNDFTNEKKKKLGFSKWMLSCPLFLLYLDKTEMEPLLIYTNNEESVEYDTRKIIDLSIHKTLKEAGIKASSKPKFSSADYIQDTVEVLRTIYSTPSDFIEETDDKIKNKCNEHFNIVKSNSIQGIKKKYERKKSWLPLP